jgi:hypothetical protein
MSQRPRCRICKKLVNDVRFGVCFKCAIQADESSIPDSKDHRVSVAIEFCTYSGGGRSPKTREAILALMDAIEADNKENPQFKGE